MLPYEPSAKQVTPQMSRRPPPEPFQRLGNYQLFRTAVSKCSILISSVIIGNPDSWISDGDLSSEGSPQEKTATVERRTVVANASAAAVAACSPTELDRTDPEPIENGAARELDLAIPQTTLLDTSAQRTRGDLARQRHHSPHSLSNASSVSCSILNGISKYDDVVFHSRFISV